MTTFKPGTFVLMDFPNTDGAVGKPRPALVLLDAGDEDVLVARVTSQAYNTSFDVPVMDFKVAGLKVQSVARLHKLAAMHKSKIRQTLGGLSPVDRLPIAATLKTIFATW
jgi:mRNA interferase MazF